MYTCLVFLRRSSAIEAHVEFSASDCRVSSPEDRDKDVVPRLAEVGGVENPCIGEPRAPRELGKLVATEQVTVARRGFAALVDHQVAVLGYIGRDDVPGRKLVPGALVVVHRAGGEAS